MRRRGLDGRAADGPDVGRRGEAAHLDDLWRHPVGRADDRVGLRVEPRGLQLGGHAEVCKLDLTRQRRTQNEQSGH